MKFNNFWFLISDQIRDHPIRSLACSLFTVFPIAGGLALLAQRLDLLWLSLLAIVLMLPAVLAFFACYFRLRKLSLDKSFKDGAIGRLRAMKFDRKD